MPNKLRRRGFKSFDFEISPNFVSVRNYSLIFQQLWPASKAFEDVYLLGDGRRSG